MSYPFSWKETDTHVPTFIIAIPWSKRNPGTGSETYGTPEITYYQVHPNMLTGQLQSNYFYRMYMKIETVGSTDNTTPVDITPSGYRIQPWGEVKVNTKKDVTGDLYRYTYLVVDPTSVVLNNTSSTTLRYSSSSALTKDTKITQVEYNSYETPGQVTHHTLTAHPDKYVSPTTWTTALTPPRPSPYRWPTTTDSPSSSPSPSIPPSTCIPSMATMPS